MPGYLFHNTQLYSANFYGETGLIRLPDQSSAQYAIYLLAAEKYAATAVFFDRLFTVLQ